MHCWPGQKPLSRGKPKATPEETETEVEARSQKLSQIANRRRRWKQLKSCEFIVACNSGPVERQLQHKEPQPPFTHSTAAKRGIPFGLPCSSDIGCSTELRRELCVRYELERRSLLRSAENANRDEFVTRW